MHTDELIYESPRAWRYLCDCGYLTQITTRRGAELARNIHRHRHIIGMAGLYHVRQTEPS